MAKLGDCGWWRRLILAGLAAMPAKRASWAKLRVGVGLFFFFFFFRPEHVGVPRSSCGSPRGLLSFGSTVFAMAGASDTPAAGKAPKAGTGVGRRQKTGSRSVIDFRAGRLFGFLGGCRGHMTRRQPSSGIDHPSDGPDRRRTAGPWMVRLLFGTRTPTAIRRRHDDKQARPVQQNRSA